MKKLIFILFFMSFSIYNIYSQCLGGTTLYTFHAPPGDECIDVLGWYDDNDNLQSVNPNEEITLNIIFHLVQGANGEGRISNDLLNDAKFMLQNDFGPLGISFNVIENELKCDECMADINGTYCDIQYTSESCLNVFLNTVTSTGTGGGKHAYASHFFMGSHHVSHEVGHMLGLYHIDHFESQGQPNPGTFFENVTRDPSYPGDCACNCKMRGDRVCDTPPLPRAEVGCTTYDGNEIETCTDLPLPYADEYTYPANYTINPSLQGQTYFDIHTENIMQTGAAPINCGVFTEGQGVLIRKAIAKFHQDAIIQSMPLVINGDVVIDQETFVDGDIEVTGTLTVDNAMLHILKGHKIVLHPFADLIIKNGSVLDASTGCSIAEDAFWEGIVMEGANEIIVDNSTVENANVLFSGSTDQTHKHLVISGSTFINNGQFISGNRIYGSIKDSDITIDDNSLVTPTSHQVDVNNSVFGLNFEDCSMLNLTSDLSLNAIRMNSSALRVSNSSGTSMFNNWYTTFESKDGVYLDILGTEINNSYTPILGELVLNVLVENCEINLRTGNNIVDGSLQLDNCGTIDFNHNTLVSTGNFQVGLAIESNSTYTQVNNNRFENIVTGVRCIGDQGSMLDGITFECNEHIGEFFAVGIDARGDIGPFHGLANASSGNIFDPQFTTDIKYEGQGTNVTYFYDGLEPTVEGTGTLSTFEVLPTGCGQIGSNLITGPPNDAFCNDDELDLVTLIQEEIDLINENIAQMAGGSDYLSTIIINQSTPNPDYVISELLTFSPYLSTQDVMLLLDNSINFTEGQIVSVLMANPELLSDDGIHNAIYSCDNFSTSSINQIAQAKQTKSNRWASHYSLSQLELQKLKAIFCALAEMNTDPDEIFDMNTFLEWLQNLNGFPVQIMIQDQLRTHASYEQSMMNLRTSYPSRVAEIESLAELHAVLNASEDDDRNESSLNNGELTILHDIAANQYGYGSNKARVLLNRYDGSDYATEVFELQPHCVDFKVAEKRSSTTTVDHLKISPNPSHGPFTFEVKGQSGILTIMNNLGSIVVTQQLREGSNVVNLDNAPIGVYTYTFKKGKVSITSGRLIKL